MDPLKQAFGVLKLTDLPRSHHWRRECGCALELDKVVRRGRLDYLGQPIPVSLDLHVNLYIRCEEHAGPPIGTAIYYVKDQLYEEGIELIWRNLESEMIVERKSGFVAKKRKS